MTKKEAREQMKALMQRAKVTELELVPEQDKYSGPCVWLWGYGTYERGSVLSGQHKEVRIECYDTVEKAKEDWPLVPVRDDGTVNSKFLSAPMLPSCPPNDFDPAYAGESWDEQ